MSDFDLTTIYFILSESLGIWLWVLSALALVLLGGIAAGIMQLRGAGKPARRPLAASLVVGLFVTLVFIFLVPGWTLADPGALSAPVDYAFAVLFALVPGAMAGAIVFFLAASRCAARSAAAPTGA